MGIEDVAKSGKPLSIGELQALVTKRKGDDVRADALKKSYPINYGNPEERMATLSRGISLIEKDRPEHARLLKAVVMLTNQFMRTRQEAIELIAETLKKPIEFVEQREKEALSYVRDRLAEIPLIIPA